MWKNLSVTKREWEEEEAIEATEARLWRVFEVRVNTLVCIPSEMGGLWKAVRQLGPFRVTSALWRLCEEHFMNEAAEEEVLPAGGRASAKRSRDRRT